MNINIFLGIYYRANNFIYTKASTLFLMLRILIYKYFLGLNISFSKLTKISISSGFYLRNNNGSLVFHGSFSSRRNLTINISNGTVCIGDGVFFNQGVSINCRLAINVGDNTIIGENVKIYDHNHRFREDKLIKKQGFKLKEVNIGENVWVGTNTVILSGVNIGCNSIISAGSVVRKDVPSNTIYRNGNYSEIERNVR